MKPSQKENHPSAYSLHIHHKFGERTTLNKKYILPSCTANNNKKYFSNHKFTSTLSNFNLPTKLDHDATMPAEGFTGKNQNEVV